MAGDHEGAALIRGMASQTAMREPVKAIARHEDTINESPNEPDNTGSFGRPSAAKTSH